MKRKGFVTAEMDKTITELLPAGMFSKQYLDSLMPKQAVGTGGAGWVYVMTSHLTPCRAHLTPHTPTRGTSTPSRPSST